MAHGCVNSTHARNYKRRHTKQTCIWHLLHQRMPPATGSFHPRVLPHLVGTLVALCQKVGEEATKVHVLHYMHQLFQNVAERLREAKPDGDEANEEDMVENGEGEEVGQQVTAFISEEKLIEYL